MSLRERWSGDDWEIYARHLLVTRYGIRYQPVFDRDRGDWGIEGYVASEATVFQCYAAEDPRSAKELYERQRNKMAADLGKLVDNRAAIVQAMGCPVATWVFFVPSCDSKRILEYAGRKRDELRKVGYSEIEPHFDIRVLTHEEFETEKSLLRTDRLRLPESDGAGSELAATPFLGHLRRKVDVLAPNKADTFLHRIVQHYMTGQDLLERIKSNYPQVWSNIGDTIRAREKGLETASLLSEPVPPLPALVTDVEARVRSAAPHLSDGQAQDIAWGTLADWLIRCPLDPRPS